MKVGPYDVLSELGHGAMGVVREGRAQDGRRVAIKFLLHPEADAAMVRFDRERRLLGLLGESQGFVPLLDAGNTPAGRPFIVMPFVGGGTLRQRLVSGRLSIEDATALVRALAVSLGRAHAQGIIHRDLKPENVLFTDDGKPLVADLGLAKHFRHDAPGASESVALSRPGALAGTFGYMPIEQMRDARAVGPPADVFALGAIFYECLAGRPAFAGDNAYDLVRLVGEGTYTPIGSLRPETPIPIQEVVERALSRKATDRYEDGNALARALGAAPSERILAPASTVRDDEASSERPTTPSGTAQTPPGLWKVVTAIGLAVPLVLVLTIVAALRAREQRRLEDEELERRARQRRVQEELERHQQEASFKRRAKGYREAGDAKVKQGDSLGALAEYTRALDLDPKDALALRDRGRARNATGDRKGARADLDRAIALDPKDHLALAERGRQRGVDGDLAGGIDDLSKAIALAPEEAGYWRDRGSLLVNHHASGDALGDLDRATKLDPQDARAWANLAGARVNRGDVDGAIRAATTAIELKPDYFQGWLSRGMAKMRAKDHEGAIEDFTRALALDPKAEQALHGRGLAREKSGDLEGGADDLRRATTLAPKDATTWYNLGTVLRTKRDLDDAIAAFSRAIELDPKDANGWESRGGTRVEKGDLDLAIEDLGAALERNPRFARAWGVRGVARAKKGDFKAGIEDLTQALALMPGDATTWLNRGLLKDRAGDLPGACDDLARFVELAPNHPQAAEVRAKLKALGR